MERIVRFALTTECLPLLLNLLLHDGMIGRMRRRVTE